jgi:hypothetical protein
VVLPRSCLSSLETKKNLAARRYNKNYPGGMVHFDTKRLPLLKGEIKILPRDYLFVGINGDTPKPEWLTTDWILSLFGK